MNELQKQNMGYLNLNDMANNLAALDELEGLELGFEKIKIPSGGNVMFELPSENDSEMIKEFSGVILHHHPLFSYYKDKFTGGNNPPDCGSMDGLNGIGNPGGNCKSCSNNQYGSGENQAKACKNKRRIYILRENELLPVMLTLPTGSIKEFSKYVRRLLIKGNKTNTVVTKFSLKKATNQSGISFSQAVFQYERSLSDNEIKVIVPFIEQVKKHCEKQKLNMRGIDNEI